MKEKCRTLAFWIMLLSCLDCEFHIEKKALAEKNVELTSKEKSDCDPQKKDIVPPIINIINKIEPEEKNGSRIEPPKKVEDKVFNLIYEKMDHLKVFETVCIALSLGTQRKQCQQDLQNCLYEVKKHSAYSVKAKLKLDENNIKTLIKQSNASYEEYVITFGTINQAINVFSRLNCDSSQKKIDDTTKSFLKPLNIYGTSLEKMYFVVEILFERAMDLGFFGYE